MKIAIHHTDRPGFFSKRWIKYCEKNDVAFKIVNCYKSDIICQLKDCDGLMWHFAQGLPVDYMLATKLIATLETTGKKTFPNYNASWHFDDKVAQKYLLESIQAPSIKSWVSYSKKEAIKWVSSIHFPIVFKLKGGAGSANVKLVKDKNDANKLIRKAFGKGFRQFDRLNLFVYSLKRFSIGKAKIKDVIKEFFKIFVRSNYEKVAGKERGYVYFQEFLPNNTFDIRIVVIGNRAFGIKRMVRKNDFRASGSGSILYDKNEIDERCVKIAFEVVDKLKTNCLTFDFLFNTENQPMIAEISYGFVQEGYDDCTGYWDKSMNWIEGRFCAQDWMVEDLITEIQNENKLHD
ncbi:ATP-grasp domain-containing protein [Maribellus sediminis]|uniref:ATP-grasp domain-containing protein n=1 Tax=Maribellus sediminis TaxID=2696285 RepID=UPI0014303F35|nr:hypothetical protein [Maribellus sediminis]